MTNPQKSLDTVNVTVTEWMPVCGMVVAPSGVDVDYKHIRDAAAAALSEAKATGKNRSVLRVLPAATAPVGAA